MELLTMYNLAVNAIVYFSIAVFFFTARNNLERIKLAVVVAGFMGINSFVGDVFLAQFFLAAWLVFMDIPLMIHRGLVLVLMVAALILQFSSPVFIAVSAALYAVILWGFFMNALKELKQVKIG